MTRHALILAAALLLAAPASAAPLRDEVDNGGFESFDATGPAGWTLLGGSAAQSATAHEGESSVVLTIPSTGTMAGVSQTVPNDEDDLPLVPGGWYELDWAALLNAGSGTSADATATLVWRDLDGAVVRTDTFDIPRATEGFLTFAEVVQAPTPEVGQLPVASVDVEFRLEIPSVVSRHDVLLFVDAVAFGPTTPPVA